MDRDWYMEQQNDTIIFNCRRDTKQNMGGRMSVFTELAERRIKCEICGADTISLYGGGWDNDRIYCSDIDCGAEYVFPTSTEARNETNTN